MSGGNEKANKRLTRDRVISVVEGEEIVGVYWEGTNGSEILFECSPEKADRIIGIFNGDEGGSCKWHNRRMMTGSAARSARPW